MKKNKFEFIIDSELDVYKRQAAICIKGGM